jgi:hypothetical protein
VDEAWPYATDGFAAMDRPYPCRMSRHGLSPQARARLEHFAKLLELEKKELARQLAALAAGGAAARLADEGRVAAGLRVDTQAVTPGGGIRIVLAARPGTLRGFRGRRGDVVVVCPRGAAADNVAGVIGSRDPGGLAIDIDGLPPAAGVLSDVVLAPDDHTLDAMIRHTRTLRDSPHPAPLVEILVGAASVARLPPPALPALDARLNDDQRRAVGLALSPMPVVLVHGPFGTGKTRTLVEIVRLLVQAGQSVLCVAASNAGVDHLALELLARDPALPLLRLGRAARSHPGLGPALIDTHLAAVSEFAKLTAALERTLEVRTAHPDNVQLAQLLDRWTRDLREARQRFVRSRLTSFRVVCGTLTGIQGDLGTVAGSVRFDAAVVDEASQAVTPALFFAACFARRAILAGDHCQLPPTVLSREAEAGGLARSGFESLMRAGAVPSHMLTVQYRCNETLMAFPSERFYGGRLRAHDGNRAISLADAGLALSPPPGSRLDAAIELLDTSGRGFAERRDASGSVANPGEADLAVAAVAALAAAGLPGRDIGVITPYAAQARLLRERLADLGDVEVDTVDAFQGREKEAIVISCVRSNPDGKVGFVDDERRINVMLTRARRRLVVIGDAKTLGSVPAWAGFFAWARTVDGIGEG